MQRLIVNIEETSTDLIYFQQIQHKDQFESQLVSRCLLNTRFT